MLVSDVGKGFDVLSPIEAIGLWSSADFRLTNFVRGLHASKVWMFDTGFCRSFAVGARCSVCAAAFAQERVRRECSFADAADLQ